MAESTVPNAFVQAFRDAIVTLAQQKGSKLMKCVNVRDVTGKYDHFERIGATEAQDVTSRHDNTPLIEVPHSRRRVILGTSNWATLLDKRDEVRMLIDPRNAYTIAGSYAMGRKQDDKILAALTGNSTAVDSADAGSSIALPAGNIIAKNYAFAGGGSDSNLTVEKIIRARGIIEEYEVDVDDPSNMLFCAINAQGVQSLMNDAKYNNRDYGMPVLDGGMIKSFYGVNFVQTERVLSDGSGNKLFPMWAKSGMGMSVATDMTVKIAERPDKNHAWQVYIEMDTGVVRVEEEKVVAITAAPLS